MNKLFLIGILFFMSFPVYASSDWYITVNNNSDFVYEVEKGEQMQCWYLTDLASKQSVLPHSSKIFKTAESYIFPKCSIGQHYVEFYGYLRDLNAQSVHTFYFANVVNFSVFPWPTYEKRIYWLNYGDKKNRDYLNWDNGFSCDTKSKNGDLYLTVDVNSKGDAVLSGETCQIIM